MSNNPLGYSVPPVERRPQLRGVTETSQVRPDKDPRGRVRVSSRTDIYTLFTQVGGTRLLYSAEDWVRITLRLETAGPVDAGTREDIAPVLSGKGTSLNDEDVIFTLPKGNRLFYSAAAVNRVRVIIEPIPWLENILRNVELGFDRVVDSLRPMNLLESFVNRIPLVGRTPGMDERQSRQVPCPPPMRKKGW